MVGFQNGEGLSEPASTDEESLFFSENDADDEDQQEALLDSLEWDEPSEETSIFQMASPAPSLEGLLLKKDEAETFAGLSKKDIERGLGEAYVDHQLKMFAQKWSKPVINTKLGTKEVPYVLSMLKDLYDIRYVTSHVQKVDLESKGGLLNVLGLFRRKFFISADFAEKTHIKHVLERVRTPTYGFSFIARIFAEGLYQLFSSQNWDQPAVGAQSSTAANQSQEKKGNSKRAASPSSAEPRKERKVRAPTDETHIRKPIPDDSDPVFGTGRSMHGTLIKYNTVDPDVVSKSIVLNPEIQQVNSKVFGDNGIAIGTTWPSQLGALAQGAHGSSQSGISGTAAEGAYSIIVTGMYKSLEKDALARFEYCATGSMDNKDKDSIIESQGLKALRTSHATRNPVRVLRGQNDDFRHAPAFGIRYDGLYTVVAEKSRHNEKGGLYAVFVLDRVGGQAPVDLTRPNAADYEQFRLLKKKLE